MVSLEACLGGAYLDGELRIASFNVENLFDRARALNQQTWAEGKPILTKHGRINALLNKPLYSAADKQKIKDLLLQFGLEKRDDGGEWVILRQNRGSSSSDRGLAGWRSSRTAVTIGSVGWS